MHVAYIYLDLETQRKEPYVSRLLSSCLGQLNPLFFSPTSSILFSYTEIEDKKFWQTTHHQKLVRKKYLI